MRFREHRVVGGIVELARRYCEQGADELVFYDITASPDGRTVDRQWIRSIAEFLDIPFCVAGGIRSVADAEDVLNKGADKISVNSPALADPDLIDRLAGRFGTQCVVLGVDSMNSNGACRVYRNTGDAEKTSDARRHTIDWIREAIDRGAGEVVLNCMNRDGVRKGYDIEQLAAVRAHCSVPLIASGGAGSARHFLDVFREADVDGALAASVFHSGEMTVPDLKAWLADNDVTVRS